MVEPNADEEQEDQEVEGTEEVLLGLIHAGVEGEHFVQRLSRGPENGHELKQGEEVEPNLHNRRRRESVRREGRGEGRGHGVGFGRGTTKREAMMVVVKGADAVLYINCEVTRIASPGTT